MRKSRVETGVYARIHGSDDQRPPSQHIPQGSWQNRRQKSPIQPLSATNQKHIQLHAISASPHQRKAVSAGKNSFNRVSSGPGSLYLKFADSTGFYVQLVTGSEAKIECGSMHRLTASRRRRRQRIRLRLRLAVKRMTFP